VAVTGFSRSTSLASLPHFLKAKSAAGLQREMLKNNTKLKCFVNYFNIQWVESEKTWYAWFFFEVTERVITEGLK
jgi:hypothetical protein